MKSTLKKVLNFALQPFNLKVKQNGVRIHVSHGVGYTNFSLASEKWFNHLLKGLDTLDDFKEGLFIDVGTNIGQTLIKLKRINSRLRYMGFEPNPHCFYYTHKLIEDNHWNNSFVFPVALSDENVIVKLRTGTATDAEGTIIENLRPNKKKSRESRIITEVFDQLFDEAEVKDLKVIKIDVEGAELKVLGGMQKTLSKWRPLVICEVLHANSVNELSACRNRNEDLQALLHTLNYEIYRIRKSVQNNTISTLEKLDHFDNCVFDKTSPQLCDFIFVPAEKKKYLKVFSEDIEVSVTRNEQPKREEVALERP